MSGGADFPLVKKKLNTEKDFYVLVLIELSRLYVNKENGQERLWTDPPKTWDEGRLGPWRSPTEKKKDTLPTLKIKCDFLLENMPENKKEKVDKILSLINLVQKSSKNAHHAVRFLHLRDQLRKTLDDFENKPFEYSVFSACPLLQDIKDLLTKTIEKLETPSQSPVESSRKRLACDDGTHFEDIYEAKKQKSSSSSQTAQKVVKTEQKSLRPILPKSTDSLLPVPVPCQILPVPTSSIALQLQLQPLLQHPQSPSDATLKSKICKKNCYSKTRSKINSAPQSNTTYNNAEGISSISPPPNISTDSDSYSVLTQENPQVQNISTLQLSPSQNDPMLSIDSGFGRSESPNLSPPQPANSLSYLGIDFSSPPTLRLGDTDGPLLSNYPYSLSDSWDDDEMQKLDHPWVESVLDQFWKHIDTGT